MTSTQSLTGFKPIGGIRDIALTIAEAVEVAKFGEGGLSVVGDDILLSAPTVTLPILEDRSTVSQSVDFVWQQPLFTHTLSLCLPQERMLDMDSLLAMNRSGLAAFVECNSGEKFLIGYSRHNEGTAPLRIKSVEQNSEKQPRQRAYIHLLIESTSSAAALRITN